MAFSATTVKPVVPVPPNASVGNDMAPSVLSVLILSLYAAKKGSKSFRKMKRQLTWNVLKYKAQSLFSKRAEGISNRTLLYILLGVLFLILLALSPYAALAVAVILLILLLAGVI